jgi:hypothetical protein
MARSRFQLAYLVDTTEITKITYDLEVDHVRPQTRTTDRFAKHIHGNEAFSLENVAKAVEAAMLKKEPQR